ncbi:cupin domain-containing protein [Saccharophagus sp. K07]|uniref:cupin domain-containing protein n=1 Tax=Saccharophagus sp. K07 TaxID=2283636 RepID=UPI001652B6D6|nr:cupin domain-containing protein [Saccharophagus sp. K07]MBC6904901.1 cupin domain-containing protein [Saccharophagus sp. K07]
MSNDRILPHLGDLSIADFLRDYWQQKPLLIRQGLPDIPQIDPDELGGYALEEGVESRLIVEKPKAKQPLQSAWKMRHGPFEEDVFASLPAKHWTLLVQAVNQLHPDLDALLRRFRFIPNWRVDDLMVSYAVDQGGVGPHFDYYDVFLLQASGKRLWKIGQTCDSNSSLRTDTPCKILTEFDTTEEWVVEPGDILYLPPRVAHWGIAQGECVTYSVGFRAPSHAEILLDCSQEIASTLTEDQRFSDPGREPAANPGLITQADLGAIKSLLQEMLADDERIFDWFGRFMTQPRRESLQYEVEESNLTLSPGTRAAYRQVNATTAVLYINGEQHTCSLRLAEAICSGAPASPTTAEEDALIDHFIDEGYLQ